MIAIAAEKWGLNACCRVRRSWRGNHFCTLHAAEAPVEGSSYLHMAMGR